MVTRTGRVKILDFGLARAGGFASQPARGSDRDSFETNDRHGAWRRDRALYEPEQARGAATDYRSDQFSLGLILFEMLTGRPAYRRATPEATLDPIINEELPSLSGLGSRVPLPLQ